MVLEHPVLLIENLLKLGLGDEGRLLYLRNALIQGKTIYQSDKKFLGTMELELITIQDKNSENLSINHTSLSSKVNNLCKEELQISPQEKYYPNEKTKNSKRTDSGILKIQNQIFELKQIESKLMDNLELLVISHDESVYHQ